MAIKAVVFDAYGTLFDVSSIGRAVADVTDDAANFTALWRAKQLEYSFLRTLMGRYADFWQITADALQYTAARFELSLTPAQHESLMHAWLHVAPFPDAVEGLPGLSHYRRAILSNGTPQMLQAALDSAALNEHFDAVLSVHEAQMFKPRPEVYALVQQHLGVAPGETAFVSSNGWDAAGAAAFGFRVYWINRARLPMEELGATPAAVVHALTELPAALQPL